MRLRVPTPSKSARTSDQPEGGVTVVVLSKIETPAMRKSPESVPLGLLQVNAPLAPNALARKEIAIGAPPHAERRLDDAHARKLLAEGAIVIGGKTLCECAGEDTGQLVQVHEGRTQRVDLGLHKAERDQVGVGLRVQPRLELLTARQVRHDHKAELPCLAVHLCLSRRESERHVRCLLSNQPWTIENLPSTSGAAVPEPIRKAP